MKATALQRRHNLARNAFQTQEHMESLAPRIYRPESATKAPHSSWALFKALRPNQWAKNLLLFMPMLFAHQLGHWNKWLALIMAFMLFSACASAVYLFNDILDVPDDRRHPTKRYRPLAAGQLSIRHALFVAGALFTGAFAASLTLMSWGFTGLLASYLVITTAYTLYVKREMFLDVIVLAGLYTLRLLTGGVVAEIQVSPWLRVFSMFFFVSLALVKRYVELRVASDTGQLQGTRRGYLTGDAETLQITGVVSGIISVVVFCLYVASNTAEQIYPHKEILWLITPLLFYWIVRVWLLARRSPRWEDPVLAATTDVNSYLIGFTCVLLVLVASL
jgi:4-hydroxybenzoate polyprenyltransferase